MIPVEIEIFDNGSFYGRKVGFLPIIPKVGGLVNIIGWMCDVLRVEVLFKDLIEAEARVIIHVER